jgi:pimeloyl-ACP methyl ester carboxylesterase
MREEGALGGSERAGGARVIAHEERGAGLPVVLLHPFPFDHSYWSPQLGAFVDHCRCIAPDRRGFGDSPAGPPYTIDSHADDVAALLDRLSIESAVIGGISMGGYVALAMWRRHRARVRGLMLFDTRARGDDEAELQQRAGQISFVQEKGTRALADALTPALLGATTQERHPEIVDRTRAMISRATVNGVVDAVTAMKDRPDSTPLLRTIDVPTLIVCGAEDLVTPPDDSRVIHDHVAGSALEIIEGAGHLSSLERPAAVNHVMREFLVELIYA